MKFNKFSTKMKKIYNFLKRKKTNKQKKNNKKPKPKKNESPIKNGCIFDKSKTISQNVITLNLNDKITRYLHSALPSECYP